MSHIVTAATSITNPNLALLRQAVDLLATHYGGTIKAFYYDYGMEHHPVSTGLALHIPPSDQRPHDEHLYRGLGLELDAHKRLTFMGDPWGVEAFSERMQQQIVQHYVALASMAAMQQMHYRPRSQAVNGQFQITGEHLLARQGVQHG